MVILPAFGFDAVANEIGFFPEVGGGFQVPEFLENRGTALECGQRLHREINLLTAVLQRRSAIIDGIRHADIGHAFALGVAALEESQIVPHRLSPLSCDREIAGPPPISVEHDEIVGRLLDLHLVRVVLAVGFSHRPAVVGEKFRPLPALAQGPRAGLGKLGPVIQLDTQKLGPHGQIKRRLGELDIHGGMKPATALPDAEPILAIAIHPPGVHEPGMQRLRHQAVDRGREIVGRNDGIDRFCIREDFFTIRASPVGDGLEGSEARRIQERMFFPENLKDRAVVATPEDIQAALAEFLHRNFDREAVLLAFGIRSHEAVQLLDPLGGIGCLFVRTPEREAAERDIQRIRPGRLDLHLPARNLEKQFHRFRRDFHRAPTEIARDFGNRNTRGNNRNRRER